MWAPGEATHSRHARTVLITTPPTHHACHFQPAPSCSSAGSLGAAVGGVAPSKWGPAEEAKVRGGGVGGSGARRGGRI